jgi:enediyne biosynthesis protein E4
VYPEVDGTQVDAAYAERKYLYRNLRNGQFEDVSLIGGNGITAPVTARGFAIGDYDNDGNMDAIVNCVNATPQLLHCESTLSRSWIKIRTVGTKSNRTGIGARLKVVSGTGTPLLNAKAGSPLVQIDEVRSCNGYFSASDLRIHFGLGTAKKANLVEIRWPSGAVDTWKELDVNRLYVLEEGGRILKIDDFAAPKKKP